MGEDSGWGGEGASGAIHDAALPAHEIGVNQRADSLFQARCRCGWQSEGYMSAGPAREAGRRHKTAQPAVLHARSGMIGFVTGQGWVARCACGFKIAPMQMADLAQQAIDRHVIDAALEATPAKAAAPGPLAGELHESTFTGRAHDWTVVCRCGWRHDDTSYAACEQALMRHCLDPDKGRAASIEVTDEMRAAGLARAKVVLPSLGGSGTAASLGEVYIAMRRAAPEADRVTLEMADAAERAYIEFWSTNPRLVGADWRRGMLVAVLKAAAAVDPDKRR